MIGVLGSGSWATALVKILLETQDSVNWYVRSPEAKAYIELHSHNPRYISSAELNTSKLHISSDVDEVIQNSEYVIIAIPSAFIVSTLENVDLPTNKKYISAVKGMLPETRDILGKYLQIEKNIPLKKIAAIGGPCHAEEVAMERLSYLTLAGSNEKLTNYLSKQFECHFIQTKTTKDLFGLEYAAVMKNIYAIATGIAHGLGYGDNYISILISYSAREMMRFLKVFTGKKRNITHSAYLGDLLVTCYSMFSRNRSFGNMIGKGYTVKSAQMEMNMIAEGYYGANGVYHIASSDNVKMPVLNAVYDILYNNSNPKKTFETLSKKLN